VGDIASAPLPWVPVAGATLVTGVALFSLLPWLLALAVVLGDPTAMPDGIEVIRPSGAEMTIGILGRVGEPALAVALLAATWRTALRGQSRACWAAGIATVCVGIVPMML
jgi:hypothetical protein